jgi:hypothetical protein
MEKKYYTVKVTTANHEVYIWKHISGKNTDQAAGQAIFGVRLDDNTADIAKVEVREEA